MEQRRISSRLRLLASSMILSHLWVSDPTHSHRPAKGGPWYETPKGWSTYNPKRKLFLKSETFGGSDFYKTDPMEFHNKIKAAWASQPPDSRWRVDVHDADDYKRCKTYSTTEGSTVAITDDGDIISVCKNTHSNDRGSDLLKFAVSKGGRKLDAFGRRLFDFYTKNGFKPVSVTDFNEEYAPDGWRRGIDDKEPIVFYRYTGEPYTEMTFNEFVKSVPHYEYDEAGRIRDKEM